MSLKPSRLPPTLHKCQMHLLCIFPTMVAFSSEISPTRCNNCDFILRNGFTDDVAGRWPAGNIVGALYHKL